MLAWQKAFREGLVPLLGTKALEALAKALREDDPRLIQNATTSPPPLACVADWPCQGACLIGYCGWAGGAGGTVGEVEGYFALTALALDERLGEVGAVRHITNHWDDGPRGDVRREFLPEVEAALAARRGAA
jgi:hypothetical protein